MTSRRRLWLLVRIAIYLTVIVGLILYRGGVPWKRFTSALRSAGDPQPTLTVAGRDLAPPLLERLAVEYQHDYPALTFSLLPGGTNQALEALLAGDADVAVTYRQPTAGEQALFRAADGDTAVVVAVGLGGLALLAGAQAPTGPVTVPQLRDWVAPRVTDGAPVERAAPAPGARDSGEPGSGLAPFPGRLYVCDPNEGSWDALCQLLVLPEGGGRTGPGEASAGGAATAGKGRIVFLADPAAVVAAVAADPASWGLVSTLDGGLDPAAGPPAGTRFVGVVVADGQEAVPPTAANVATGDYPLHHFLYVACRGAGSLEGGKFVTHMASARGLRQVERAGVVPARLMARTIQLSRDPVGGNGQQGDGR